MNRFGARGIAFLFLLSTSISTVLANTQVADPVLAVSKGTSSANVTVTVTDSTSGAAIHYTTDGSTVTTSSPTVTTGGTVLVNIGATFKVQAYSGSLVASDVVVANYAANGIVSSGSQSAVALKNDGTAYAWGANGSGQLGTGNTTSLNLPTAISFTGAAPILGLNSTVSASDQGMSTPWEIKYFGATGQNPNALSSAGDGYTLLQESQLNRNPNDYYQGVAPFLSIVTGNSQTANAGSFVTLPLIVQVANAGGVLVNAPVTFTVTTTGNGGVGTTGTGGVTSSVSVRTDGSGHAIAYFKIPTNFTGANLISVSAGTATPVIFTENVTPSNAPTVSLAVAGGATAPAALTLTATTSTVTKVDFYEGTQFLGTDTSSPYTLALSAVGAGPHTYTAVATNSSGFTSQANYLYTVNVPEDQLANYRFNRGTTGAPQTYISSLIAVGFEQGLRIDDNDASQFTGTLPWFMQLSDEENTVNHITYTSSTVGYNLPFKNPIAAFGKSTGGTPLYTNQNYSFGIAPGGQIGLNGSNINEITIQVYSKTLTAPDGLGRQLPLAVIAITLPTPGTTQWDAFAQNGYVADIHLVQTASSDPNQWFTNTGGILTASYSNPNGLAIDLDTQIQFATGTVPGDLWNQTTSWPLLITHKSANSDYEYKVNYLGTTRDGSNNTRVMASDTTNPSTANSSADYNLSYTLDFNDQLPWNSTFLAQPHFQGQPLPSAYAGKSTDELMKMSSQPGYQVNYQFNAPDSTYSTIGNATQSTADPSPELKYSPILDKFVSDMGNNPVALTNYVLNHIQLTDAISYNDSGPITDTSIDEGGVNRGALATFEEKEGNPAEQCALEIYFLRKCGIPCGYVFPPYNSMQMLDVRMSNLLRMQLHGAVDPSGTTTTSSTAPTLINVNYPWVAAYIGGQWVHIFPWLKDTSITEGYNLPDYLPKGYQSGLQWLQAYIHRDTSLLPSGKTWSTVENDNPGYLYPLWVNQQLSAAGLSQSDVGVTVFDRQNNFQSYADLPQPWSVTTTGFTNSITATSRNIYSSLSQLPADSSGIPLVFDTIQCIAYSDRNNDQLWESGEPKIDSGTIRSLEFHNRRFMVREVQTGSNTHQMQMTLEAFRPGTTVTGSFASSDAMTNKQLATANLTSSDDQLKLRLIYNRHRKLPSSFFTTNTGSNLNPLGPGSSPSTPAQWSNYMGVIDTEQSVNERPFRKGDAITLCVDFGRVTQDMLNVQEQNFWSAQQSNLAQGTTMDEDTAVGTPLYLMGMSYYKQVSDFRTTVEALQKQTTVGFFASGLSKMSPQRNADGTLPNNSSSQPGAINLLYPNVDMYFQRMATAYNGTLHPDSGMPEATAINDWLYILIGEISAQEHTIINKFFNETDTASTVHLLHDTQAQGGNFITLSDSGANSYTNYQASTNANAPKYFDPAFPTDTSKKKTLQDWAGTSMWTQITNTLNSSTNLPSDFAQVYITPGPIICASKTYEGMGALVLNPGSLAAALITSNGLNAPLNGAWSASIDTSYNFSAPVYFTAPVVNNSYLSVDNTGLPAINISTPSVSTPIIISGSTPTFQVSSSISNLSLSTPTAYLDPFTYSSYNQSYLTLTGNTLTPTTVGSAYTSVQNSGGMGQTSFWGQAQQFVSEPVDSITGAFYINHPDLVVPGPMPISINRNYNSLNQSDNGLGYGWKFNYVPYLELGSGSNSALIYAAEADGSVIAYRLSGSVWTPQPADNPQLVNQSGGNAGSVFNLFNNKITRSGTEPNATYTLTGADGSVRTFVDDKFPLPYAPGTATAQQVTRQRPYLTKWADPQGNYLTFTYGGDDSTTKSNFGIVGGVAETDYGYLNRIASSNGNFVQLNYDTNGHVVGINAADGRRLTYNYDSVNGDLTSVVMPDASTISYTYQHLTASIATVGHSFSYQVPNSGLSSFTATGLPAGLSISSSGLISGSPTTAGSSSVITSATGSGGATVTSKLGIVVYSTAPTGTPNAIYSTHLITQETKPEGRVLTNAYDGLGRVTQQQATVGANNALVTNAKFAYSTSTPNTNGTWTGNTQITDVNNQVTRYDYTNSNITTITDQLAQTIVQTWSSTGSSGYPSLHTRKDQRGLVQTFSYDSNGNVTNVDTAGNLTGSGGTQHAVKSITNYTAQNLPGKVTEANNNYVVYTYGTGAAGSGTVPSVYEITKIQSYAANGTLVSETDNTYAVQGTVGTVPFAAGVLTQVSKGIPGSSDLSTTTYTYGTSGFPTSETDATATNDPAQVYTLAYNLRGQLVQKTDSAGRYTKYTYDDLGNPTGEERHDQNNNIIGWNYSYYNSNGEIEWTQGSRYNPTDYTTSLYDGGGRLHQHLVWLSQANSDGSGVSDGGVATTLYTHDSFGDLTQIMDPRGNIVQMGYDYLGQMTSRNAVDVFGTTLSTESWTISHDGGKTVTYTNPLGGVTTYKYTDTGKIQEQDNPAGSISVGSKLFWTYNSDGRVASETLANGSQRFYTYNDDKRQVVQTLKDSSGNVLMVDSQTTDSRGNVTQKVDGEGYASTMVYDGLNRIKTMTGPPQGNNSAQQQTTYSYDAAGITQIATDALGESTVTTFDARNRPTQVQTSNASGQLVRRQGYEYSPDGQAVTTFDDTKTNITTTYTDLAGKPLLVKQADNTFVLNVYDAAENPESTTDQLGRTTSYGYDGLNRLGLETLPDGAQISLYHDNASNLTSRVMPGGLTWSATYDNASRKQTEKLTQGALTTRSSSFTYYPSNGSGGITGELKTATDGRGIVTTYKYDSFARIQQAAAIDGTNQLGVTTSYQYDRRNLATAINQSYQNSTLSPPTAVYRSYDGYGAIAWEETYVNGALKDTWSQNHDGMGRRTSLKELNYSSLPFSYSYRADGLLAETDFNGAAYQYTYGTDGLLTQRNTPSHIQNIVSRDPMGRILEETQSVNGSTILDEKVQTSLGASAWRGDSTQGNYIVTRTATANSWNESRAYTYDDSAGGRGHLTNETFAPSSGTTATLQYSFDGGGTGGLGLRTSINLTGNQTGTNAATYGTSPQLGNQLSSFTTTGSISGPLGTPVSQSFDGMGHVGTRQPDGTTDTMTWDALGRLMSVSRRNSGNGFNWSAIYDGLGRRQQTSQQNVTGGTPTGSPLVIQSSYDPNVEFLELGVTVSQSGSNVRDWLVHGPDLNGVYGGLHGTGGVEAVYNGTSHVTTGIVSDLYGHTEATVANNVTTTWNAVHSDGYGPFPGSSNTPVPISASQDVSAVLAWHGKYVDGTGYYYLGARYYAPDSGTFLSCDPAGHAASMDLYSYCNGDPVNSFDPDGRFGTQANAGSSGGLDDYLASRDRQFQALVDQTERAGTTGPAPSQAEQESQTLNAIPLVGSLKMLGEGITGYDAVTGQYLSTSQQLGNAALGAVGILPAGALEDSLVTSTNRISLSGPKTGHLGGEIVDSATLDRVDSILRQNKSMLYRNADAALDQRGPGTMGLFAGDPRGYSAIALRSNATKYVLYHELKHFGDFNRLGFKAFKELGEYGAEKSVYDYMVRQTFLNPAEQVDAKAYFLSFKQNK